MRVIDKEDLDEILRKHKLWIEGENGGERADLRGSNLSGSDLRYSNLRGSNLRGSNLRGSNLSYSDLSGSDLRGSNLRGSNLSGSNLRGSDLSGSDLRDSNLSGSAGNRNEIKSLFISETYPITYTSDVLQIGCERHLISEWWTFDNDRILKMDGKKALKFWKEYKDIIRSVIEVSPAKPTKS